MHEVGTLLIGRHLGLEVAQVVLQVARSEVPLQLAGRQQQF